MSPSVLRYFKKFCENVVGGKLVNKTDVVSCIKETEAVGSLDEYIDEFHSFVNKWKGALDKPVEIVLENRLLGGWSEVSSITYDPKDDEYSMYVRFYSEGVAPEYVEGVREETIEKRERVPYLGVLIRAEGEVDQNSATDEFVGVGEAWASISRGTPASELKRIYRKIADLADRVANEAREKLIIPY